MPPKQAQSTEREERCRRDRERLAGAMRELLRSDGWKAWLRTRATLNTYSFHTRAWSPKRHAGVASSRPTSPDSERGWSSAVACGRVSVACLSSPREGQGRRTPPGTKPSTCGSSFAASTSSTSRRPTPCPVDNRHRSRAATAADGRLARPPARAAPAARRRAGLPRLLRDAQPRRRAVRPPGQADHDRRCLSGQREGVHAGPRTRPRPDRSGARRAQAARQAT